MKPINRTVSTEQPMTETREGKIPAVSVNVEGRDYWLVVKLRKTASSNGGITTGALRLPKRDDQGRLVYAVPGGGSYVVPV